MRPFFNVGIKGESWYLYHGDSLQYKPVLVLIQDLQRSITHEDLVSTNLGGR